MLRRMMLCGVLLAVGAPASAQTVDEIIAKHIAARGGVEKIKSIQSVRMVGKMTMGPALEAPLQLEFKRPSNVRTEVTVYGQTGIQGYDGSTAWRVMPFAGINDPQTMDGDDLKDMEEQADMDGLLIDSAAKGTKVELVGKEQLDGVDAYNLKITLKNGDVRNLYIDAARFLEVRVAGQRNMDGKDMEFESRMSDYREIGGTPFPFVIETGTKDKPGIQKIVFDKIEVNVPLDDTRFKMPPPSKPVAKPDATPGAKPGPKPDDKPAASPSAKSK